MSRIIVKNKGFTLVELLVVMFVVGALSVGFFTIQKKLIDWKNSLQFEKTSQKLESAFKGYYARVLNYYSSIKYEWNYSSIDDELGVVPICSDGSRYIKGKSGIQYGALYVCAKSQLDTTNMPRNINYASTADMTKQVMNSLVSAVGGGLYKSPYDEWKHPLIFLIFRPFAYNHIYCPIEDRNTAKIIIISLGPDGKLNLPSGVTNVLSFLKDAITDTGQFNSAWSVKGDDLAYFIDMQSVDLERKSLTIDKLETIANALRNRFFSDFYKLSAAQPGGIDVTHVNFFSSLFCKKSSGSSCSKITAENSSIPNIMKDKFGYEEADLKDAFGNFICVDFDIHRSYSDISCQYVDGMCIDHQYTDSSSFFARVYSVCGLSRSYRKVCNSSNEYSTVDLWKSGSSVFIFDASQVLTVGGMY